MTSPLTGTVALVTGASAGSAMPLHGLSPRKAHPSL